MDNKEEIIVSYDRMKLSRQILLMIFMIFLCAVLLFLGDESAPGGWIGSFAMLLLFPIFGYHIYAMTKLMRASERAIVIGKTGIEGFYWKTGFIPYKEIKAVCLARGYNGTKWGVAVEFKDRSFDPPKREKLSWLRRAESSLEGCTEEDFSIDVLIRTDLSKITPEKLLEIISTRITESD